MENIIKKAHDAITRIKGKEYAPNSTEIQDYIDKQITMAQQTNMTAVGAIYEQLEVNDPQFWNANMIIDWLKENKERFIKMEKEQIIKGVLYGNNEPLMASQKMFAEQYYNETYGGEK